VKLKNELFPTVVRSDIPFSYDRGEMFSKKAFDRWEMFSFKLRSEQIPKVNKTFMNKSLRSINLRDVSPTNRREKFIFSIYKGMTA
jgi:hypothetical protein